jgi:hypothetical protein
MPTTPVLALRYPSLTDPGNPPQDIQNLALDAEAHLRPATTMQGNAGPAADVSLPSMTWQEIVRITVTLVTAARVQVSGVLDLVSTGTGRPNIAAALIQDPDGAATKVYVSPEKHMGGSGDSFGDTDQLVCPPQMISLSAGATVFSLQGHKDSNGVASAKKTHTIDGYTATGSRISYSVFA